MHKVVLKVFKSYAVRYLERAAYGYSKLQPLAPPGSIPRLLERGDTYLIIEKLDFDEAV